MVGLGLLAGRANAQGGTSPQEMEAMEKTARKALEAGDCKAAEDGYLALGAARPASEGMRSLARRQAAQGLARVPQCYARAKTRSSCAALALYTERAQVLSPAQQASARKANAPLYTLCAQKPPPIKAPPKVMQTVREPPPPVVSWLTWSAIGAGAIGGLALLRGALVDDAGARGGRASYLNGVGAGLDEVGLIGLGLGAALGATALTMHWLDAGDAVGFAPGPGGVSVGGRF